MVVPEVPKLFTKITKVTFARCFNFHQQNVVVIYLFNNYFFSRNPIWGIQRYYVFVCGNPFLRF